jgi:esterase/lipase superfamily enzyme
MNNRTALTASASGLFIILLVSGCGQSLMATPNLIARSEVNPFDKVPPELRSSRVEVLYATDRVPEKDSKGNLVYGCDRSKSLAFGTCVVEIGQDLSWDDLVGQSRTQTRLMSLPLSVREIREQGRFPEASGIVVLDNGKPIEDPALVAQRIESEKLLRTMLARHLQRAARKEAFIYVHGFNNTFDYAACVLGQIWHFMGRTGIPIIYTWPAGSSEGALGGYTRDRESGEFTGYHLKQFLKTIASCPDLEKINLIAHSRGTDVLLTALRELNIEYQAAGKQTRSELKLGNVVLAAADLDMEVISQRVGAEGLLMVPERLTVYVSRSDRAIGIADLLFGSKRRVGQMNYDDLTPLSRASLATVPQIQIIDASH